MSVQVGQLGGNNSYGGGYGGGYSGGYGGPSRSSHYGSPYDRSGGGGYSGGNRFERGSYSGGYGGNEGFGNSLKDIDYTNSAPQEFQKNFYVEHNDVARRSPVDIDEFRKKHGIQCYGNVSLKPVTTFGEANFPDYIYNEIKRAGFVQPTGIQCQAFPYALSGVDLIGLAETGSGKTLAFALPAIVHIMSQRTKTRPGDGPVVLVLAPTRELACQTEKEFEKYGASSHCRCSVIYGGVPKGRQIRDLRNGAEVVIATPGRLIDMLESGVTNLRRTTYLCMDEADRMLDMGFEPQIRKIIGQIRPDRQTLMWSATWPKEIQQLARDFLNEPVMITIGNILNTIACHNVHQEFIFCSDVEKPTELLRLLDTTIRGAKTLVFTSTKRGADQLTRQLRADGTTAYAIHGDKKQEERDYVINEFKRGSCKMMIATDVAARGLDIKDVQFVINYDMPGTSEDYVHRIGRTGRAGEKGRAISFFTAESARLSRDILNILQEAKQEAPKELLDYAAQPRGGNNRNNRYRGGGGGRWRGGGGGGNRMTGVNSVPVGRR